MEPIKENKEDNNLSQLVVKLKTVDSKKAKSSKVFQIVFWIYIPLFIIITATGYIGSQSANDLISGFCYILAFLIFALFYRKYYKDYKNVDYSLPTLQMLKKAVWRYQLLPKRSVWIFLGLAFMDVGFTFNWSKFNFSIVKTQIIYLGIMFVAIIIGLIRWYVKHKPIRDEALQLIEEIEGE